LEDEVLNGRVGRYYGDGDPDEKEEVEVDLKFN
jgi:hypothetical protein